MQTTGENDPIREFQTEMKELSRQAEKLRPLLKACEDAVTRCEIIVNITIHIRDDRPTIAISLLCESLKETIPLFRELAKEGLKTDKKDSYKDNNLLEIIPYREYNLGPDLCIIVMILNANKKESTCRMEQVGVKKVPIYEMKCDE